MSYFHEKEYIQLQCAEQKAKFLVFLLAEIHLWALALNPVFRFCNKIRVWFALS